MGKTFLIIFLALLAVWHLRGRWITRNIETPSATSSTIGDIEIRQMDPMLVASVLVAGDEVTRPDNAFRQLAGFIFGDNTSQESINMTAPVTSKQIKKSEKIDMTAPVTSTPKGEMTEVSFVMPSKRTKDSLPLPNNPNISITEIPSKKIAVWSFGGYATDMNAKRKKGEFLMALAEANISRTGEMTLAQYNDPRTPAWMRTNEWWVDIVE